MDTETHFKDPKALAELSHLCRCQVLFLPNLQLGFKGTKGNV